jgi:DNA-binding CsgD family transcriptional regulator
MTRTVFVIHSSNIVRKGLTAILRSYFNLDVTQLEHVRELASFMEIENTTLLLFSGLYDQHERKYVERLRKNNFVHHFCIVMDSSVSSQSIGANDTIGLNASMDEIQSLVSKVLNKTGPLNEKESTHSELTVREKDVLKLVAMGHSSKEIADKLSISVHTVISHRKNVTEKLGIKSISGLTVYAILNKIINPDQIDTNQLI